MSEDKTDADIMTQFIRMARHEIWQNPNVEVLRPELADCYPVVVRLLQDVIRARHERRELALPDLEACDNKLVALFSDYSGESSGKFHTYSFLTCAGHRTDRFSTEMLKVRAANGLAEKEIAFKDFHMGQMRRAIPEYLSLLNSFVPGFLLTVVVDKRLPGLFGSKRRATQNELAMTLRDEDLGVWKPQVAEKLLRVVHIGAFLIGLLAAPGQEIFWMSDNDAICADDERHRGALELFRRFLDIYTDTDCQFRRIGGAVPFKERHLKTLDLLSIADVVSGSVEHYLTQKEAASGNFKLKEGADKILQWLAYDGIGLKKMNVIIEPDEAGNVTAAELKFALPIPPKDVTIIPVEL